MQWVAPRGAAAALCVASVAQAQPTEPFRLVYSSSAGCGEARAFVSELKGRTTRLREAQEDEHAITLIVETFRDADGVRGQLTVREPDGELSVREVPGSSCHEVESAMALIAALMVDPLAGSAERASASRRPEPAPPAAPSRAATPSRRAAWSLRLEHRLTARSAIAPELAWGQAGALLLTRESSEWRPSVGLAAHVARTTTSATGGSAELDWVAAQLSLCPFGYQPGARWDLRACGAFQLGRLRGVGFATASPASKAVFWSSAGLSFEARYQLLGPLWLGGEGGFTFPLLRERFYLEPQQTLHRVPSTMGWRFRQAQRFPAPLFFLKFSRAVERSDRNGLS